MLLCWRLGNGVERRGGRRRAVVHNSRKRTLYWLCLNTAYVFEFYMQSLVKRGYLSQGAMLVCQQVLMGVLGGLAASRRVVGGLGGLGRLGGPAHAFVTP